MLRKLEAEGKEYHIVGDLNCNLLDTEKNVHSRQLTDIMDIYQLEQIITEPTRITMDLSPIRQNFEKNRNGQKYHHSLKEHPTFTKIVKFGCEML